MDINVDRGQQTVIWCDRCKRVVNTHDEHDHFHREQCGGCRKYRRVDSDWGWCKNQGSICCGRLMFEHDTCSAFIKASGKSLGDFYIVGCG